MRLQCPRDPSHSTFRDAKTGAPFGATITAEAPDGVPLEDDKAPSPEKAALVIGLEGFVPLCATCGETAILARD